MLTAVLYSGTTATGTPLATLSATDTALTGGFQIGMGGDTGTVITNAIVTAPIAQSLNVGSSTFNQCLAVYAADKYNGNYSLSLSATGGGGGSHYRYRTVSQLAPNTTYTLSFYAKVISGTPFVIFQLSNVTKSITVTGGWTRYSVQIATTASINNVLYLWLNAAGTVLFDSIQVEVGFSAGPYVRNDSTSTSATNAPAVSRNDVYRRPVGTGDDAWKLVATGATSPHSDYSCPAGTYEYGVRGVSAGGALSDYGKAQVSHSFSGQWLIDEINPMNNTNFLYNNRSVPIKNKGQAEFKPTFGRRTPRKRSGLTRYKGGTLTAMFIKGGMTVRQQLDQLAKMEQSGQTYLLKTDDGGIYRMQMLPWDEEVHIAGYYAELSIEWEECGEV